ncbi:MAG: GNAT family N-acetyltransferase, partial [Chloroflexota bacterium]
LRERFRVRATAARAALRPLERSDFALVEPWYAKAAAAVRGGVADMNDTLEKRFGSVGERLLVIADKDEPTPIGLLEYNVHSPAANWLRTDFIAMVEERRGFGYGSEAVRALEEWAERKQRITSFLAEIEPRNGLALYFWLRLGYRPAHAGEVFWRAPDEGGIIAMIRSD